MKTERQTGHTSIWESPVSIQLGKNGLILSLPIANLLPTLATVQKLNLNFKWILFSLLIGYTFPANDRRHRTCLIPSPVVTAQSISVDLVFNIFLIYFVIIWCLVKYL